MRVRSSGLGFARSSSKIRLEARHNTSNKQVSTASSTMIEDSIDLEGGKATEAAVKRQAAKAAVLRIG